MNIEDIRNYCSAGRIQWTDHTLKRMFQRGISRTAVKNALLNGHIIEDYPDDFPYPSCLVVGITTPEQVLHVVCGIGADQLWIITTYIPDPTKWDPTFAKRRETSK